MNGIGFKIVGWLLIVLAICVAITEFFLFMLSGWGICGDAVNCNPLEAVFSLHPNALAIVILNISFLFALISIVLTAYGNFKFADIANKNKGFDGKVMYLLATIGSFLSGIFIISSFFEIIRNYYFLIIFNLIVLIISIYFTISAKSFAKN